jgi:hypothetical protein
MTRRIFISYRRDDSKSVSSRMYDRLANEFGKQNIFKDVNVIPPGVDFREYIQQEIAKADIVLAVIGTRWEQSLMARVDDPKDFVRIEIESAFQQKKLVIPVTVEGAKSPNENNLPESIRKLAYINSAKVDDDPDFHPDMDRLIALLRTQEPPSRRGVVIGMAIGLLIAIGVLGMWVLSGGGGLLVADNPTPTTISIPTPDATTAPFITSFGGIWLLSAPSDTADIIGSNARPAPIAGKSADGLYYLVYVNERFAWVRINNFTQLRGDANAVPIVDFVAPSATPTPNITATPRPTVTPRPTSEFAQGYSVSTRDEFDTALPRGWKATPTDLPLIFENSLLNLQGRNSEADVVTRSGYFTGSGVTTAFMLLADANGAYSTRFYLSRGIENQDGYRYFGIEPKEGDVWYIASRKNADFSLFLSEFILKPNTVYELTIILQDKTTFVVTLIDRATGERPLDQRVFTVDGDWTATVGNPITWGINPLLGTAQIDRVETLVKSR